MRAGSGFSANVREEPVFTLRGPTCGSGGSPFAYWTADAFVALARPLSLQHFITAAEIKLWQTLGEVFLTSSTRTGLNLLRLLSDFYLPVNSLATDNTQITVNCNCQIKYLKQSLGVRMDTFSQVCTGDVEKCLVKSLSLLKLYVLYSLKHSGEVSHFHFNRPSNAILYLHLRYLIISLSYVLISTVQ